MTYATLPLLALLGGPPVTGTDFLVERISTKPPFPRGLQIVDGQLYVLCRGRVREYGGVSAEVEDQAGTLYVLDPAVAEAFDGSDPCAAVRENGQVVALPTAPPFKLWDRSASPPSKDKKTDRPYCGLTYHPGTQSFYICAFSGIDKPRSRGRAPSARTRRTRSCATTGAPRSGTRSSATRRASATRTTTPGARSRRTAG
jgi:hypothetical protein